MFRKVVITLFLVFLFIFINNSRSQDIPLIRIGVAKIDGDAYFSNVGRMSTDFLDMKVEGKGYVKIKVKNGSGFIETNSGILGITLPLRIYPDGYYVNYNSNYYRGYFEILPSGWLVNVLNMEEYLMSVVPSEMPASYPLDALKAQAVASRTYALVNKGKHGEFDLCNTTHCQVYKGMRVENERSTRAVMETIGEIVVYNNQPIKAFFHSSSGGFTEDCKYVWGEDLPYLKGLKDSEELLNDTWSRTVTFSEFINKLSSVGINIGGNFSIELEKTSSGRIYMMYFKSNEGIYYIKGTSFRNLFNLPSTLFDIVVNGDYIIFSGRGNGHGVGLSQKGAKFLAEKGYNYKEILKFYYQGVEVAKWY
ncbi:MAG: SpoIID/LytB domain-containing protein [Dictyoglomus thermophilum]|uniref:SpoIID/LytB domain-containing protein n=1 Tax=Dictyoglomus thermophilum TaxID=14 RepID=A0A7V3ZI89_DICTH|nr:SpoIID/LytB domain-containing protein [Dictyoglomus thermophilum]MCX7720366.1 SpoIID/LytB domain-containing protein [Dictyoglomus thermophilum]TYT24492.1 SpoIID/LytB domain-containing protein [Dictyoglomus thermophilum]